MVSVVVPVYNTKPELVKRCIESIQNQIYRNLEIIVVFNGCTYGYVKSIKNSINCKDIKFVEMDRKGVSVARNAGIDIANGEFIAFADADDVVTEVFLESAVRIIEDRDLDMVLGGATMVYSSFSQDIMIKHNSIEIITGEELKQHILFPEDDPDSSSIKNNNYLAPWAKLYRRDKIGDLRFAEGLSCGEDLVFNYEVATNCSKVGIVGEIWYNYYQYDNSAAHSFSEKMVHDCINIIREICRINSEYTIGPKLSSKFAKLFYIYVLGAAGYSKKYSEWKKAVKDIFREMEFDHFKKGMSTEASSWSIRQRLIINMVYFRLYPVIFVMGRLKRYIRRKKNIEHENDLISMG